MTKNQIHIFVQIVNSLLLKRWNLFLNSKFRNWTD